MRTIPCWRADEEGVVEPGVLAVDGRLELRGGLEIECGSSLCVGAAMDDASVAHVDIDPVIGPYGVDGFQLRASLAVGQLVVGSAVDDGAFE